MSVVMSKAMTMNRARLNISLKKPPRFVTVTTCRGLSRLPAPPAGNRSRGRGGNGEREERGGNEGGREGGRKGGREGGREGEEREEEGERAESECRTIKWADSNGTHGDSTSPLLLDRHTLLRKGKVLKLAKFSVARQNRAD